MRLTFKYVWRRQVLQARCHCNLLSALDGRVLRGTIFGFLFENLFFVCYSQKVLFSTRPMLENKQTCAVKHRGVIWVSGCVVPPLLSPSSHPELFLKEVKSCNKGTKSWASPVRLSTASCSSVRKSFLFLSLPCTSQHSLLGSIAGRLHWLVANNPSHCREEASQEVLWVHAWVCVLFLRRNLNFSYIYITDLFTNKKCYVL